MIASANDAVDRRRADCPNCRGAGIMMAVWRYVDSALLTQQVDGDYAPNNLRSPSGRMSPRSNISRDVEDPRFFHQSSEELEEHVEGGTTEDGSHCDRLLKTYHIQARLADGRPALVVDPGSVGNLCGDQ